MKAGNESCTQACTLGHVCRVVTWGFGFSRDKSAHGNDSRIKGRCLAGGDGITHRGSLLCSCDLPVNVDLTLP